MPEETTGVSISVDEIRRRATELESFQNPAPPTQDLGKEAFLKLLTVQLKNQDPLSPVKNADFVAELAQFSSLEQLQNINATLEAGNQDGADNSGNTLSAVRNNTAVSMIGKQVEVLADRIHLPASDPAQITYNLDEPVDRVTAEISDALGNHVRTIALNPEGLQGVMLWDGKSDIGVRVPPGDYRIALTAQVGARPVNASSITVHEVTGVRTRDGSEPLLIFDSGSAPLSSVSGIFTRS